MKSQSQREPEPATLLVTIDEAARRLSIGRSHLYEHLLRGTLRSVRIGRSRRIPARDLEAFIDDLLEVSSGVTSTTIPAPQIRPVKRVPERPRRR
jgi:excisionase family DNA binding protein